MVSFNLNLLVKNMYKLYLPVSRRGKNCGGRCRVLCRNLLVSNFASMRMMFLV